MSSLLDRVEQALILRVDASFFLDQYSGYLKRLFTVMEEAGDDQAKLSQLGKEVCISRPPSSLRLTLSLPVDRRKRRRDPCTWSVAIS
jgi:hypothetical protein